jgi:hypothetical protein
LDTARVFFSQLPMLIALLPLDASPVSDLWRALASALMRLHQISNFRP